MIRQDVLPVEFAGLQGKVGYVQKVSSREWSSSCPSCGGVPHKNGELPDRFRMWTNANGKNKIMGWCRSCSYVWFPKNDIPLTPEEFARWKREQIAVEERRKLEAEKAIELLKSQKLWEFYHSELNEWAYEVLDSWGICKENAAFWKLGLIKDYVVRSGDESYHSPAISIPCWNFDGGIQNIKVRVLNPQSGKDRYRSIYKVGRDVLFVARPDIKDTRACVVVEGEKKAMVVAATKQDVQVVGVQTKSPSTATLRELDRFDKIYLILDPDAKVAEKGGVSAERRMVDVLDKSRTSVVHLPGKVDDLILRHGLVLEDAMRFAT